MQVICQKTAVSYLCSQNYFVVGKLLLPSVRRYEEIVSEMRFLLGKKSVRGSQFISKEVDMLLGLNAVRYDHVASFPRASKGLAEHFFFSFKSLTRQSCKCRVTRKVEFDTLLGSFTSHGKRLYLSLEIALTHRWI